MPRGQIKVETAMALYMSILKREDCAAMGEGTTCTGIEDAVRLVEVFI